MIGRRELLMGTTATLLARPAKPEQATVSNWPYVSTHHYDNNRTGWNQQEKILNWYTVRQQGVHLAYSLQMEGDARGCEAQLLIVPNVLTRTGYKLNIAIQASMSDGVWGFNADTGEVLWSVKLGMPVKGDKSFDFWLINDNWGILGTPVIDPDTNILYCVTWSSPDRTRDNGRYYAHAINAVDGSIAANPIELTSATYDPGHGLAKMTFGTIYRKQRTALLLVSSQGQKAVIVCFAAGAESASTNHGWVLALSVSPFKLSAAWNDSPHYQGGGIWMAGGGPAADADGNIYLASGNGSFDAVTDFGESAIKLKWDPTAGTLTAIDWFTPYTDVVRSGQPPDRPAAALGNERPSNRMSRMVEGNAPVAAIPNASGRPPIPDDVTSANNGWIDQDLGSAGVLLVPNQNTMLVCGKDGIAWNVNTQTMGKTQLADFATPDKITANYAKLKQAAWFTFFPGWDASPTPSDLTKLNIDYAQRTHHQHSTPVYYESPVNGPMVFCAGENGPVRAWKINNGKLTYLANSDEIASPQAAIPAGGMTGGMMTACSDGKTSQTGLLIVVFPYGNANHQVTDGYFVIYNADTFDTRPDGSKKLRALWKSSDWGINFKFAKFTPPIVAGGKIFIPTYSDKVDVYQLT